MSLRPDWAIWDTRSPKQGRWIKSINYIINYISSWFSIPFENLCVLHTHVYSVQTCERSERRPTASSLTAFSLQREGLESQDMSLEWGWQPTNHNAPPVSTSAHPLPHSDDISGIWGQKRILYGELGMQTQSLMLVQQVILPMGPSLQPPPFI